MREKSPFDPEIAAKKRRKEKMEKSQGFIVALHGRYSEKDPCFYLDDSTKDLFQREILEDLYPGYLGWMSSSEQEFLKEYIFTVYKDWQVKQSFSNPNNYNQKNED